MTNAKPDIVTSDHLLPLMEEKGAFRTMSTMRKVRSKNMMVRSSTRYSVPSFLSPRSRGISLLVMAVTAPQMFVENSPWMRIRTFIKERSVSVLLYNCIIGTDKVSENDAGTNSLQTMNSPKLGPDVPDAHDTITDSPMV